MRAPAFLLICTILLFFPACQPGAPVGAIPYDSTVDDPSFMPCDEEHMAEYYRLDGPVYGEGLKTVRQYFADRLSPFPYQEGLHGYITVRFIVNCRGETGRFRLKMTDERYRTFAFPETLSGVLLAAVKDMGNWSPGRYEGAEMDSYVFLTFRIRDGQLQDILP